MTHGASHEVSVNCEHDCWQALLYHIQFVSKEQVPSVLYLYEHLSRHPLLTLLSQYDGQGERPEQVARHLAFVGSQIQLESCMHAPLVEYLPAHVVWHVPLLSWQKSPVHVVTLRMLHFWMQLPSAAS
jgi:hypothetical protein